MDILGLTVSYETLGIWLGTGFVLGVIFLGGRPLGFIGDVILGMLGAFASGFGMMKYAPTINLAEYLSFVPEGYRGYAATALAGAIGAIVLLILFRILIRR